jgi:hypothetical protein
MMSSRRKPALRNGSELFGNGAKPEGRYASRGDMHKAYELKFEGHVIMIIRVDPLFPRRRVHKLLMHWVKGCARAVTDTPLGALQVIWSKMVNMMMAVFLLPATRRAALVAADCCPCIPREPAASPPQAPRTKAERRGRGRGVRSAMEGTKGGVAEVLIPWGITMWRAHFSMGTTFDAIREIGLALMAAARRLLPGRIGSFGAIGQNSLARSR